MVSPVLRGTLGPLAVVDFKESESDGSQGCEVYGGGEVGMEAEGKGGAPKSFGF